MRINEAWKALRKELNDEYEGITIGEYGKSEGKIIRGPHITLMIPAEVKKHCPHCQGEMRGEIPMPSKTDVFCLKDIINRYLCDVTWDDQHTAFPVKREEHGGGLYRGIYYKIVFDKVESV